MDHQTSLFDSGARARTNDPDTSKAAAKSVRSMRASHKRVLAMFTLYGDMTDEELATALHDAEKQGGLKLMSPSGIRSRRNELSAPNMERIEQIVAGMANSTDLSDVEREKLVSAARHQLRIEGFKSELWDTGRKKPLLSGRDGIVWGIAR